MLTVPILIAICLFLGWALIKLAVNALPLFAGMTAAFALFPLTGSLGTTLAAGTLVAVTVSVFGPIAFQYARSGPPRIALAVSFALPAAVAAWHAVQGSAGHVMTVGSGRDTTAFAIAIVVGGMAWRRLTKRTASTG